MCNMLLAWSTEPFRPWPALDWLIEACLEEPHGYGFLAVRDGKYEVEKSLSPRRILKAVKELGEVNAFAFHGRAATSGKICVAQCHPLAFRGHYLFMNGIAPLRSKSLSDAALLVRLLSTLDGDEGVSLLENFDATFFWFTGPEVHVVNRLDYGIGYSVVTVYEDGKAVSVVQKEVRGEGFHYLKLSLNPPRVVKKVKRRKLPDYELLELYGLRRYRYGPPLDYEDLLDEIEELEWEDLGRNKPKK